MAELDIEKQKALAIAQARRKRFEAQKLESEVNQRTAPAREIADPTSLPVDGPKGDEAVSLPIPNEVMYEGMSPEDQKDLFDSYARHPQSEKSMFGHVKYKGIDVPAYQGGLESELDRVISPHTNLAGGIWNGIKEGAKTVSAANQWANDAISEIQNPVAKGVLGAAKAIAGGPANLALDAMPSAQTIEENVPSFQPKGGVNSFMTGATEIGVGMAGPNKIPLGTIKGLPRLVAGLAKFVASNAGGAATMDEDVKTLVTGDNAEFAGSIGKLGLDETGTYDEKLLKHRMNMTAEAVVLSGVLGSAGATAGTVGRFVKSQTYDRLANWGSMAAKDRVAAQDFIVEMGDFSPFDTPEQEYAKKLKMAERIRSGAYKVEDPNLEGVDKAVIERPTARAYIEGSDSTAMEKARASGLNSSALAKGTPELEAAMAQPALKLDKALGQTREVFGGKNSAETARKEILKSGEDEVGNFTSEVSRKADEIKKSETDVTQFVRDDPTFGKDLPEELNLDIGSKNRNRKTKVVEEVDRSRDKSKASRDQAYKDIPDDTPADMKSFNEIYQKTKSIIPKDVQETIEGADGTFKYLNNKVRPLLSRLTTDAYNSNNSHLAERFRELRDNISLDQTATLRRSGNRPVSQAADKASAENMRHQAEHGQGVTGDLSWNAKVNKNKPADKLEKGRAIVTSAISDPNRKESVDILKGVLGPENEGLLHDIAIGDVLENVHKKITVGGKKISELNPDDFVGPLFDKANSFSGTGKKRIEDFAKKLQSHKGNLKALEAELEGAKKQADEAKRVITKGEQGKFYDQQGLSKSDADDVFSSYLSDKDGLNAVKKLSSRAESEEAKKGLKSSYAKFMEKEFFRSGEGAAGEKNINQAKVKDVSDDVNKSLEFGDVIHGKDSSVMKMYRGLIEEADKNASFGNAKKVSMTAVDKGDIETRSAFDFAITLVYGTLNRIGSRLRSVSSRYVATKSSRKQQIDAIGSFYAHPEKAADLIENIAKEGKQALTREDRAAIRRFLINTGTYKKEDLEKVDADEQTEKALPVKKK